MADFITCPNKDSVFNTLLRAIYAQVDADETYGLRVVQKTKKEGGVITCNTKDDFEQLFRQALDLADDSKPALRICVTDFADGAGLTNADECGIHKSLDLLSRIVFVYTTDDEVALSLLNIT